MNTIGVIEGFFGPQWPMTDRMSYASFLSQHGGDFYIYAPKQDPYLRKKWRENWDQSYLNHLRELVEVFHHQGIKFGVGLSPFGLGTKLLVEDVAMLEEKLTLLDSLGIDVLGLFFDDMPTNENLAQTQIETLQVVQRNFQGKVIFCPSYYTPDPILDKVFGARPPNYLNEIAEGVPLAVSLAWTGPKVISSEISVDHLVETASLLKRKPFLWENLFANDGPRNCKFLKIKAYSGRSGDCSQHIDGIGFNMMNQPQLSKILYLASKLALEGEDPDKALKESLKLLCTPGFSEFVLRNQEKFLSKGLDGLTEEDKAMLLEELKEFSDGGAREISDWLIGKYNVGSECLTD